MKNRELKKILLPAAGVAAAAVGAAAYILSPGRAEKSLRAPFYGRNFAHRGLHTPDKSIPENSLPAFEAAAKYGYGVELDVHITKDGKLIVFHDDEIPRACGVQGRVSELSWGMLSHLRLFGTEYRIPLLSEVLGLIGGRVPVIVELKRGGNKRELCEKTYALLKDYRGAFCIESFDPRIVRWFRKNAPGVLRGQLARHPSDMAEDAGRLKAFLVGNLLTNFYARPHFIAYGIGPRPLTARLCELLGAMKFAWTAKSPEIEKNSDAVIFEHYFPKVKYK